MILIDFIKAWDFLFEEAYASYVLQYAIPRLLFALSIIGLINLFLVSY